MDADLDTLVTALYVKIDDVPFQVAADIDAAGRIILTRAPFGLPGRGMISI